jgi:hypothetical protein
MATNSSWKTITTGKMFLQDNTVYDPERQDVILLKLGHLEWWCGVGWVAEVTAMGLVQ